MNEFKSMEVHLIQSLTLQAPELLSVRQMCPLLIEAAPHSAEQAVLVITVISAPCNRTGRFPPDKEYIGVYNIYIYTHIGTTVFSFK